MTGSWRLRKAVAMSDARHYKAHGVRPDIIAAYVRGARYCHKRMMEAKRKKRDAVLDTDTPVS